MRVLLNSGLEKVERMPGGKAKVFVSSPNGKVQIEATHILAAAGRVPNTDNLDLEKTGVRTNSAGFVSTNPNLGTDVPGIYAMGDVKGGPAFTHISYDDFRVLKANVIDGASRPKSIEGRSVPYTVFIDPQLGRIGMTETEAKTQGKKIRVAKMPMAWVARALEMDESQGMMKVIVENEKEGDRILGAAVSNAILGSDFMC